MRWKRIDKKELKQRRLDKKDSDLKRELDRQFDWFEKCVLGQNNQELS